MNVLSTFDGMSCLRIVLDKLQIPVSNYFASEIDKYVIQVSKANWNDVQHIGDVTKVFAKNLPRIDLLAGGSPCQGFSFAGKQLNFEDPRSKLFFEFVRLLKEIREYNPGVYFFLENVVMKKEYQAVISEALGVQPILINSALVCAQNRKRLYWTNIPFFGQPEDRGIVLKDILETDSDSAVAVTERRTEEAKRIRSENLKNGRDFSPRRAKEIVERLDSKANCLTATQSIEQVLQVGYILNRGEYQERNDKAMCLDANYYKGADNHGQRTLIQQINPSKDAGGKQPYMQDRVYHPDFKSICVTAGYAERLNVGEDMRNYRKLTVTECERLQGVPDGYTQHVSSTQAYKMLGNGWQIDTIEHLLEPLKYVL